MITYIYAYRDREIERVKRSLDSLMKQEDKDFKVIFIDYGSKFETAKQIKELLSKYCFVKYIYTYTQGKPWNKSIALNIGIKQTQTKYILSADVDMIFHPSFNRLLKNLADENKLTFFQVGYLDKHQNYDKTELRPVSYSNHRATGICLFPKSDLLAINGYDEFFICWGAEDEDVIVRLTNYGLEKVFYTQNILVYHQYHKPFKELKHKLLSEALTYNQVRYHNDKKRRFNENETTIKVNENRNWGEIIKKEHLDNLQNTPISRTYTSFKSDVDFFLFFELKHLKKGYWGFKFVQFVPKKNITVKYILYRLWTIGNRDLKTKEEYSLKEVNDLLLKFLVYGNYDFHLQIDIENASLELRINII